MTQPSAGGLRPQRKRRRQKKLVEGQTVVKDRVEVEPSGAAAVIDSKPGPVTVVDKAKGYYHTIIIVVTAILGLLTEVGPIGDALGDPVKTWVAGAIVFIGAVLTFLKSNEVWINRL